jgi:hypothetical protein
VWNYRDVSWPPVQYVRKFFPAGNTRGYSSWALVAGGGGGGYSPPIPISDVSGLQTALDSKPNTTLTLTAGLGLTGGGDLSASRSFVVDFAGSGVSSATKAVRADDARLSDARTPVSHTHALDDVTAGTLFPVLQMAEQSSPGNPIANTALIYAKTDGKPYWKGDDNIERPLLPITSSLHANPTFDLHGGSPDRPTNYDFFWIDALGSTAVSETSDLIAGAASLKLSRVATGFINVMTSIFTVTANGTCTLTFWAKGGASNAKMDVVLMTTANGTDPQFFDSPNTTTVFQTRTLTTLWKQYTMTFGVPSDAVVGRFAFTPTTTTGGGADAVTVYLDESTSYATEPPVNDVGPFASRYISSNLSIPNGTTATTITFGTNTETTGMTFASGIFTIQRAGRYMVNLTAAWDVNATNRRLLRILQNGSEKRRVENAPGNATGVAYSQNVGIILRCAIGDTIAGDVIQTSGVSLNLLAGANNTAIDITWMGY